MREMKESGIPWIGEIPKDWQLQKGRYLFKQRNEKGNKVCLQLLSPSQRYGVIPQSILEKLTTQTAVKLKDGTDLNSLKTVHKGDFCISLRSFQGGFEYSLYEGVVSPAYQIFYKNSNIADSYYRFMFKDKSFIEKMNSYTMSLRDGKNIAYFDFGNTYLPVPPIQTQQQIADFLDAQCAEIDGITAEFQKEITVLEAYKKSVITEAVTKGLNPKVEMKESGIPWMGKIPRHWQTIKIKYMASERNENAMMKADDKYIGLESVTSGKNEIRFNETEYLPSIQSVCKVNDIMFSKLRPYLNKVIICPYNCFCTSEFIVYKGFKGDVRFLRYFMTCDGFINTVTASTYGAKMPRANSGFINNLYICYCEKKEQQQISDYLDTKCMDIDATISDKQKQLEILADYKKSLIYEYVTGKKEVPSHE